MEFKHSGLLYSHKKLELLDREKKKAFKNKVISISTQNI